MDITRDIYINICFGIYSACSYCFNVLYLELNLEHVSVLPSALLNGQYSFSKSAMLCFVLFLGLFRKMYSKYLIPQSITLTSPLTPMITFHAAYTVRLSRICTVTPPHALGSKNRTAEVITAREMQMEN
jgi:hypothetical protein